MLWIHRLFYQKMKKKSGNIFGNALGRVEENGFPNDYWQFLIREGKNSGNS